MFCLSVKQEIDIKKQGNMSSYAFIQFSDISSVVKAMRKLDGENLGQNRIKLGFGKSMPTPCVWIHGVSEALTEKSLLWHANRFGTVVNLVIDRERSNALIFYDTVECAQIAVQDLKGRVLSGRKLQVDFASRECQTAFFDYLELSGQITPGDRPWTETRTGRQTGNSANSWQEFDERIPNYDSHQNSTARSVSHSRYQSRMGRNYRPQSPLPPFGRNSQTSYGGRGRASYQRFAPLPSDSYSEDFVDRRHRNYDLEDYDDNEEGFRDVEDRDSYTRDRSRDLSETCSKSYSPVRSESPKERRDGRSTSPYSKSDISNNRDKSEDRLSSKDRCSRRPSEDVIHDEWKPSTSDPLERRRPKHKSCDSDIIMCHSPPPPASVRRLSHSKSPLSKDKAPALVNSKGQNTPQSPTASPCSSSFASPLRTDCTDVDVDKEFEPSCGSSNVWRRKSVDDSQLELTDALRLRSDSISDSSDNGFAGRESLKRKRVDNDSPDTPTSSEAIGHLERKKRLLACLSSSESIGLHKERLGSGSSSSQSTASKTSSFAEQQSRRDIDSFVTSDAVKFELAKLLKRRNSSSGGANSDIKYLESKSKGSLMSVIEQCIIAAAADGQHSVDTPLADTLSAVDSKTRSKHNINSITKGGNKCSYGAKDSSGSGLGAALRVIDATSTLINHLLPDPRRPKTTGLSSLSATPCSAQLCSTHATNCKQIHRKLERSDAIYEMSCDSDVTVLSRVSSSDIECTDRTLLKTQDLVHTTTPKLEDHCSSEVSSSSDKVRTCPLSLPLPEFAITSRAGGTGSKVQNIPVVQPSHPSPKSTTIMSPLGQMSPNSVVPKVKTKVSTDVSPVVAPVTPLATPINTKEIQCLVSTTDNPDSNTTLSDIKAINVSTSSSKEVKIPKTEQPFDEVSDPEMSPNRSPTIEERIKALDEKYNAWSGTTSSTAQTLTKMEKTPTPTIDYSKYNIKKKSQISAASSTDSQSSEPSDIVKNLLSKSSIFDQDSKRLELINEKYEPKDLVSMNFESMSSPITKPVFRTKAAAKEFSTPTVASATGLPTDKDHTLTPKSSSLSHHSSHHPSLHTSSVAHHSSSSSSVHHSSTGHPIPGAVARKLSEPTRMPSAKKEPLTPTTPLTPAPNTAPARTGANPFSAFSRSSSQNTSQTLTSTATSGTTPSVTRLPQSNLLGGLNIKKESTIPSVNCTVGSGKEAPKQQQNRDPRENRDPRVVAKKENTLHNSIISNTSATNILKDHKKDMTPIKSEFQKKVSSALPPHLASSGFSSKAQSFPTTTPVNSRQDLLNKQKSDPQLTPNKKNSINDALETTDSDGWSRLTNESKDKSLKSDKVRHLSQTGSLSKDSSDSSNVQKNKSSEKTDKKSSDLNKSLDKNKIQSNISNKSIKDEKKCIKNKDNKQVSKNESKDKDKESKESKDKEKSKSKSSSSDVKSEKQKSENNPNKEKTQKSEKEKKDKKEKTSSKDKSSKNSKLSSAELKMLLSIPDTDEPIYFSMYDKVKARSSANQNLKVAKDMECVRQKFSQLKDKRQKHDDKKTSQDTDSDSDDSLRERKKKSLQKKRKIIFDTSSDSSSDDEETVAQKNKKKLSSISKVFTDSDSDLMTSKPVTQKSMKKSHKDQIYSSDSSMGNMSTISSPKMSTSSSSKKSQKSKQKSSDESSDDDVPHKQMKKKKELKKKVKKEKSDKTKTDTNVTKETIKTNEKSDKNEAKVEKISHSLSDSKSQSLEKIKKNKLSKDKDNNNSTSLSKEQKKRKENSGTDNDNECKQQQKLAKRKKKKAKTSKLFKEKRHSSSSGRDRASSMASDEKPTKHSAESSSSSSVNKNTTHSDHEMRSSGMSDLEECLKRDYPEIKSDESDSETRIHVLKCYNKDSHKEKHSDSHKEKHSDSQQTRGVVSHTEWERAETTKPSNEKSVSNASSDSNKSKGVNKSCTQLLGKTLEKSEQKSGIKSPKKLSKESFIQKEVEIGGKTKKEIKSQKEDKQSIKDELKRKKMKKQIKNKEKEKDRKDKSIDKEPKDKTIDKELKDKSHEKTKEKDRSVDKEKESKKNKPKEESLFKSKSPSPLPKTPDLMKSSLSPTYSDLMVTNDSSSSDSKVDEDLLKNARMLEECMMAAGPSDDSNSSSDDLIMPSGNHSAKPLTQIPITNLIKPTKEEQKQQRRYEEEAAIQSLRLQKELMEERTDHHIKDMKRPFEELSAEVPTHSITELAIPKTKPSIDETIFAINSVSKDVFAPEVESIEKSDETKESEIDDQRKMEDDLAVAALLQDMNDPIVKDSEEYKEPEDYVSAPSEQIDEISYMGMLGDEEPPLQIAESPPEALQDETCAALKSISDDLSEKSPQITEKTESTEELTKDITNEMKTEAIVPTFVEQIKKEPNEWQTTHINTKSEITSALESITSDINSLERIVIKSPEIKSNETIESLNEKFVPFVEELVTKEETKQSTEVNKESIDNRINNKSKAISSSTDNNVVTPVVEEKPEQKASNISKEDKDNNELSVSRLLSPSPLLPSLVATVSEDKRDTCSDGGVSDRTEIFDEEAETEPQTTERIDTKPVLISDTPTASTTVDTKPQFSVSPVESKAVLNDESRDESESDDKRTNERPRRGRRAKTRKYSESSLQLPRYETGCVPPMLPTPPFTAPPVTATIPAPTLQQTSTPIKRGPKPMPERSVRRSGRTSGLDSSTEDHQNDELSGDEHQLKIDEHPPQQSVSTHEEEPKKANKRGRKKKISGTELPKPLEEPKKERILLSLPVPSEKQASDVRKSNSPYDVFEFRDSDEEDSPQLPLESIHKQSTELSKPQTIPIHSVPEMVESKESHPKPKHTVIEETPTVIKATPVLSVDSHHTHTHQDQTSKEYVSEVSQHGKLSITIRLHPKEGQDGAATSTAEVVKTSKALFSEETDVNKQSAVKLGGEQPIGAIDAQSSKGIRKSARLMSQVPKTTVDETIEDVIKGSHKEENKSKRITRSSRKSEESLDLDDEHNDGMSNPFPIELHLFIISVVFIIYLIFKSMTTKMNLKFKNKTFFSHFLSFNPLN